MNKKFLDLMEQFNKMCGVRSTCEGCPYEHCGHDDECRAGFVFDYFMANGEKCQNLQKSPLEETGKNEEPKLPSWCKVGTWVFNTDRDLCKIVEERGEDVVIELAYTGLKMQMHHSRVKPARFRPYTFDEAMKLLCKTVLFTSDKTPHASIIHDIRIEDDEDVLINHYYQDSLMSYQATIDGIPFGVPEINKKAMKEDEE